MCEYPKFVFEFEKCLRFQKNFHVLYFWEILQKCSRFQKLFAFFELVIFFQFLFTISKSARCFTTFTVFLKRNILRNKKENPAVRSVLFLRCCDALQTRQLSNSIGKLYFFEASCLRFEPNLGYSFYRALHFFVRYWSLAIWAGPVGRPSVRQVDILPQRAADRTSRDVRSLRVTYCRAPLARALQGSLPRSATTCRMLGASSIFFIFQHTFLGF